MKKKSIVRIAALVSGLIFSVLLICTPLLYKQEMSTGEDVVRQLSEREQLLWDNITTSTGITKQECIELADRQEPLFVEKLTSSKKNVVSKQTRMLIEMQLKKHGIEPDSILILPYSDPDSAMAASVSSLYINESLFKSYDQKTQAYVLAHEIAHLNHRDPGIQHALGCLMEELDESLQNALSRFCEERADTEAFLHGVDLIEGALTLVQQREELYGKDASAPTHPSFKEIRILAQLLTDINQNEQQTTAA